MLRARAVEVKHQNDKWAHLFNLDHVTDVEHDPMTKRTTIHIQRPDGYPNLYESYLFTDADVSIYNTFKDTFNAVSVKETHP